MLWARDRTQRVVFGVEIPASTFATLLAVLVFVMMPLATLLSRWRVTRTVTRKLIVGMLGTALSMAVLALAALLSGDYPATSDVAARIVCPAGGRRDSCRATGAAHPRLADPANSARHHGCGVLRSAGNRISPRGPRRSVLADFAQAGALQWARCAGLARLRCRRLCIAMASTVAHRRNVTGDEPPILRLTRRAFVIRRLGGIEHCPFVPHD